MPTRRQFINKMLGWFAAVGFGLTTLTSATRHAWAGLKRKVLDRGTDLNTLVNENPAHLDAGEVPVTPLDRFETMGLSDHKVALDNWHLTLTGAVKTPQELTYDQLLALPVVERNVLLICPGFFAYKGRWKGVSIRSLLELEPVAATDATHIVVSGPVGPYEKRERFEIGQIDDDKLFLAYAVNGQQLPQKHGYPLRLVAEDHYGSQWVKYVQTIDVQKIEKESK